MTGATVLTSASDPLDAALAPVAAALLDDRRRQAGQLLALATRDSEATRRRAHNEARQMVDAARRQGVEAAGRQAGVELAATGRQAHRLVLEARRRAYETLRQESIESLDRRQGTAEARKLMDGLTARAAETLGTAGGVSVSTAGLSLEMTADGRRVAVDPATLIDRVLDDMAEDVEKLWA